MEVYTLDALLRRVEVVDQYISLIWTERFDEYGDFELIVLSSIENRRLFVTDTLLACDESNYVMKVQFLEDATDDDGNQTLKITGPAIESILDDRVAFSPPITTPENPNPPVSKWTIVGPVASIARGLFHDVCVLGVVDINDVIPYVTEGTFLPESTIPEDNTNITLVLDPQPLGTAIKNVIKPEFLGFRLIRQDSTAQLYFDIYAGSDRTTSQNVLEPVVFTPELDNLQDTKQIKTTENYKNVAYVFGPAGIEIVYADNSPEDLAGFERRVLVVIADDIPVGSGAQALMIRRGKEELAQHRNISAFDGEVDPNSNYKYGVHYFLGDVVEVRASDGSTNQMRVTEQIFVSDKEGYRTYPTLSMSVSVDVGSWLSWASNQVWSDLGTDEVWENQP